ncbi:hypothetical protein BsWGS_18813 [Bradybaena similaris]
MDFGSPVSTGEYDRDGKRPDFNGRDHTMYDPLDDLPSPVPMYSEFIVHDESPSPEPYDSRSPPAALFQGFSRRPHDSRSIHVAGIPGRVPAAVRDRLIDSYNRCGNMNLKVLMSNGESVASLNFRYQNVARDASAAEGVKFLLDLELQINPVHNNRDLAIMPCLPPDQFYSQEFPLGAPERHSRFDFDEPDRNTHSHSFPACDNPPPTDYIPLSGLWRGPPPGVSDQRSDDWERDPIGYRTPPADTATDTTRRHDDYFYGHDTRHYQRAPGYSKSSYGERRSPERSRVYRNDRRRYDDWDMDPIDCRIPPVDTATDTTCRHDYLYGHDPERHRELAPGYSKSPYGEQRSPERSRSYRTERAKSRENDRYVPEWREYRNDRAKSRENDCYVSARRDYRAASPEEEYIKQCLTLSDLSKLLPLVWNGALILKSSTYAAHMHIVGGNVTLVDTLMRDSISSEPPVLRLTQRFTLDQPKLDDVARRIQAAGPRGHCILLAVPSSISNYQDNGAALQQRPLSRLVTYLKDRDIAGLGNIPQFPLRGDKDGILYAFPPCDFGFNFLKILAPKLSPNTTKEDHLVIVVVHSSN